MGNPLTSSKDLSISLLIEVRYPNTEFISFGAFFIKYLPKPIIVNGRSKSIINIKIQNPIVNLLYYNFRICTSNRFLHSITTSIDPPSVFRTRYEMFYGENALFDFRTKKYLARIVTSPNQLIEKIQIFDAGKDDRIMELVKLLVTDSLHENNPDKEFDELRFAVDDDGTNILIIINKGEITGAVDIDNMYEFASSHCTDFKDIRDDEDIVINREWILNKLAEAENE